jgi:UTP--glucose-1-phosphate uridylyltransferase
VTLADQLDELTPAVRRRLDRYRFDRAGFLARAATVRLGQVSNAVTGRVDAPAPGDIEPVAAAGSAAYNETLRRGEQALRAGEVAIVVLAGGMATRMGGVVKALVEVVDGLTFLEARLRERDALERRYGAAVPLWLMTSAATDEPIRDALTSRGGNDRVAVFTQSLSLRLTTTGDLYLDATSTPSEYAPGHGDLIDALQTSGLVDRFVLRGGRQVMIANLDNLGATLDPLLVGTHRLAGQAVTVEVVDAESDRGGIPVRLDGKPVILEDFRIPPSYDPARSGVFNTNTFHIDAAPLAAYDAAWTWFCVHKRVDDADVVQFERLLGEVTSHLDTRFVRVARHGVASRFLPVKDSGELARRAGELTAVLQARGMLP